MIKNAIYSGIGVAALTTNKIKELVEDLIQNEQLTKEEGKRLVDAFLQDAESRRLTFQNQLNGFIDDMQTKIQIPGREQIEGWIANISKNIENVPFLQDVIKRDNVSQN